ncbi:hypothetical protein ACFQ3P_33110 [Paraburkholderia sabiae]|uniref:Uncharacterized protein n=1 Tax=Paraburkholderia sabiae TaxID=273251 RepID=A0ABU9QJ57_9BURK|nr:hypothetical protein [Paraburkholderia sabiae]WJZ79793.1 hypothetical protein QEN71_43940 [Paraburkholderia sabiae]CAD6559249.1 hypothetical protein LMG24235_06605 [Paraburkholderia sabiae]
MTSNSFFLQRAIPCDADWHVSYPALCMASSTDPVDERRKQIVAATADDTNIRMVFFSSLGAILDFQASWDELDAATQGWLAFTTRWNRWWLRDVTALTAIDRHAHPPSDVRFVRGNVPCIPTDTSAFRQYLDSIEYHYRRDESISRILFAPDAAVAA